MRVIKLNGWRCTEMLLGLMPASLLIGPLLPYGIALACITLIFCLVHGVNVFKLESGSLSLFLSIFAAAAGLWSLWWIFLFGPVQIRARRVLHMAISISLIAGLAADCYWFRQIARDSDPHWYVKPVWLWILLGPLALGLKYLFLLFRRPDFLPGSAQGSLPG